LDRRITLDLRLDPAGACVCLNRSQVEQIVMNLLLNARDAMQGVPGSITISTCMRPAATRLRIRDTGAGMTEEIRRRIFEPFFTTKAAAGGTGLGLSTVHAIVATVGGTIEIESTPGAGSVFELRFPPCPEDQPAGRTSDSLRSEPM
jgi:signal transduction histidine kinase